MTTLRSAGVVVDPNVFKQLRTKHNFSLEDLARKVHISKHALIRLEQGTFARPLPSVIDWWVDNYGYSWATITEAYEGFREATRLANKLCLGPTLEIDIDRNVHPLRQIRLRCSNKDLEINPSDLAKRLCVPQATLQHFERKWRTQQSVPRELIAALMEVGYTTKQVRAFSESYNIWRRRMLNKGQL